ncbi:MAG: zinc-ribbon domain-containing protein [Lachnospiraceae bacterium]|nr:zinc-ribbon domain-containing protein [Lachnospiraceae bacterium]
MALVKCPECGRENVSSTAKACPECGYNVKEYYDKEQNEKVAVNTAAKESKFNVKILVCIVVVCIIGFCIYYFSTRCAYDGCTEGRTSASKYCAYHEMVYFYSATSNNYTPKTGKAGAEARAESYLNSSAFSYTGLIEQLEYEGFSEAEAIFAADNCGADWNLQAVKKAESYLRSSAFSYSGLKDQLLYEGFTADEAQYGIDNCNADWYEQADKKAKSYLRSSPGMGKSRLIEQLEYEGFTYDQALYGVEQAGL